MTHHGDALELCETGHLDTSDVLASIYEELMEIGKYNAPNRTKIKVLGSQIKYPRRGANDESPFRVSYEVVRTLGYLKRCWGGNKFDLEEYNSRQDSMIAQMENDGDRRSAWGLYSNIMHQDKVRLEDREFETSVRNLSSEDRKKKEEERNREKSGLMLFIG